MHISAWRLTDKSSWQQGPQHASQQAVRAGNGDPARGLDNLLYSADADFSCFADLALTSPVVSILQATGSSGFVDLAPGAPGTCASQARYCRQAAAASKRIDAQQSVLGFWQDGVSRMFLASQDYYREGEGSLMQCVLTPADAYMPLTNEAIAAKVDKQVNRRACCAAVVY